jgi:hypothetical protein
VRTRPSRVLRVKEKRKGALGRATGIAESMAATVRRLQRDREPRVLLYDAAGESRLLQPESRGYDRVLAACDRMVALVNSDPGPADEGSA